ncbi:MAG: VCBS repeat-containing protein [Gemmatimonadota bacterium]
MKIIALLVAVAAFSYSLLNTINEPGASAEHEAPAAAAVNIVTQAFPAPNSAMSLPDTDLRLMLREPLNQSDFESEALSVFGRWSGVVEGTVTLEAGGTEIRFVPSEPFQAGESVTAALRAKVPTAGGSTDTQGYAWSFWIRPAEGSLDLANLGARTVLAEGEEHVQPYGAYAGDFNEDGLPDLAIPNEVSADVRVMINDGNGNYSEFEVLEMPGGNWPSPNEGADFDRDGITDFVVGNAGNDLVSMFIGDGRGGFRMSGNTAAAQNVRGVCIMDLNADGWPDVATVNMGRRNDERTAGSVSILLNDRQGRLVRTGTIESPGSGEKTCATADANEDGIPDLLVGAYGSDEVLLFLGDGHGGLALETRVNAGGNPWMVVAGDINGDGHVDAISANRTGDNVAVLFGDGAGGLAAPVTYPVSGDPLAVDVGDIDGDGDLDVVTSEYAGDRFTIYENAGDGTLINPRWLPSSGSGSCAIIHDRDRDGDLDITGVDEKTDNILLFENTG